MKTEISAGGVIYKRQNNIYLILILKDKNDNWTFPKGLIEKNESKETAAKREIAEEVGLKDIRLCDELSPIGYWYKWKEDIVKKKVFYFLFEDIGNEQPVPQNEEGIQEVKWVPLTKAKEIVGYPKTNKPVIEEVEEKLKVKKQDLP